MIIIGLTGGIGMGKSTVAAMFARHHVPVFDADAEIHRLQAPGGQAIAPIQARFAGVVHDGVLDRAALRGIVLADRGALRDLESTMHKMVRASEQRFIAAARRRRARAVLLDIPLLFETKSEARVDVSITVSARRATQIARVRRRGRMSDAEIAAIIGKQMPDHERRRRADYVIPTGLARAATQCQVRRIIKDILP